MELIRERNEIAAKEAARRQMLLRMFLLRAGVIGPRPPTLREDLMSSVSRPALVIGCRS